MHIIAGIMLLIGGIFSLTVGILAKANDAAFWLIKLPMVLLGISNCFWAMYSFGWINL